MAEHGTMEIGKAAGNDYVEHQRTYSFFLKLLKYSTLTIAIIMILMAIFLL